MKSKLLKISYSIIILGLCLFVVVLFTTYVNAEEIENMYLIFGPEEYIRVDGKPQEIIRSFYAGNIYGECFLVIENGKNQGDNVSSAIIKLNDKVIIGPNYFNKKVQKIIMPVQLKEYNTMSVRLMGKPGSSFIVRIISSGQPVLNLINMSENSFNNLNEPVKISISTEFNGLDNIYGFINGMPISKEFMELSSNKTLIINSVLIEGKNELFIVGEDKYGNVFEREFILWAGNNTINGLVLNENNQPVDGAQVKVLLSDNQEIMTTLYTNMNGEFSVPNLPNRTIIFKAYAFENQYATKAIMGEEKNIILKLKGFDIPSNIDNNDFSEGTAGWNIGSAPVEIIPHIEEQSNTISYDSFIHYKNDNLENREMDYKNFLLFNQIREIQLLNINSIDKDLKLSTLGEGEQTISRTFYAKPGARSVKIRFKFITSEVPGGYFGTQYNDYYSVSIRSKNTGNISEDSNSMNGLGLSAFNAYGETDWRELSLPIDENGDIVEVNLLVANVADGLYDSSLIVDFIDEQQLVINQLALNDIDNSSLRYLSVGEHPYFGGNTRIHGTVSIAGANDDRLQSLVLEMIQNGVIVGCANLADSA